MHKAKGLSGDGDWLPMLTWIVFLGSRMLWSFSLRMRPSSPSNRRIVWRGWAAQLSQPDAEPFDLQCPRAFNAPVLTHRHLSDRENRQQAFCDYYGPEV